MQDDQRLGRRRIASVTLVAAVLAGASAAPLGPWVVELVFGPGTSLGGTQTGLVVAGATVALGTLVMASRYTAQDDTAGLVRGWIVGTVVGLAGLLVPVAALGRVLTWFLVTECVALVVLGWQPRDGGPAFGARDHVSGRGPGGH